MRDISDSALVAHQPVGPGILEVLVQDAVEPARLVLIPVDAVLDVLGSVASEVVGLALPCFPFPSAYDASHGRSQRLPDVRSAVTCIIRGADRFVPGYSHRPNTGVEEEEPGCHLHHKCQQACQQTDTDSSNTSICSLDPCGKEILCSVSYRSARYCIILPDSKTRISLPGVQSAMSCLFAISSSRLAWERMSGKEHTILIRIRQSWDPSIRIDLEEPGLLLCVVLSTNERLPPQRQWPTFCVFLENSILVVLYGRLGTALESALQAWDSARLNECGGRGPHGGKTHPSSSSMMLIFHPFGVPVVYR